MVAAGMGTAAVIAAGVALAMVMVMVITPDIGIEIQLTRRECFHRRVCAAGHAAVELNARRSQSHLGTAANAAADQHVRMQSCQDPSQGAVAAALGIDHFGRHDLSVLHLIDLKLGRMAEVLENLTVFISNCNFHCMFSFRSF